MPNVLGILIVFASVGAAVAVLSLLVTALITSGQQLHAEVRQRPPAETNQSEQQRPRKPASDSSDVRDRR
mgnify:CR=1 FL=1